MKIGINVIVMNQEEKNNILNYTNNLIEEISYHNKDKKTNAISVSMKDGKTSIKKGKEASKDIESTRKDLLGSWKKYFKNLGTFDWDVFNKDGLLK